MGIALGIEVAHIVALHEVEIVERALVAAHVALVEQVHAYDIAAFGHGYGQYVVLRRHHDLVFAA